MPDTRWWGFIRSPSTPEVMSWQPKDQAGCDKCSLKKETVSLALSLRGYSASCREGYSDVGSVSLVVGM